MATDVDKARAKKAYDSIRTMISKKDLNSDNLFEDLISEKAFELDRVSHLLLLFLISDILCSLLVIKRRVRKIHLSKRRWSRLKISNTPTLSCSTMMIKK